MTVPSVAEDRPQDQTPGSDAAASSTHSEDAASEAGAAPDAAASAADKDAAEAPAAPAEPSPGPAAGSPAPPDGSAQAPAGETAPTGSDAAAEVVPEAAEGAKRRVRLNPTFDPQSVKPIPTLGGAGEKTAAASGTSPAAPAAATEASEAQAETAPAADEAVAAEPAPIPQAPSVEIPTQADLDATMEAEIAAALESGEVGIAAASAETVEAAAAAESAEPGQEQAAPPPTLETATEGTKLKGTIQSIHEDNVFVDFGWRLSGVVSLRQFNPKKPPKVGDKIDVLVVKVDEDEGLISCRLPRGRSGFTGEWHAMSPGQVVDCVITKTNKGGLEVNVGNLRGFMPASQVEIGYVADLAPFVGQKVQAKVTEVNPARRRLVVSRRQLLEEERVVAEKELMEHLEAGQTITGKVKTIKDYGAFIDLGGVDGFLHIGQISWVRIGHPNEVLSEGQQVDVKVLSIDEEKKKISLGMRQLSANPWTNAEAKYSKGTQVTGKVTRTEAFGAFVELEPGVEGLVHISELDYKRVRAVTDVLTVGQTTTVQVLEVNPQKKRVSLSLKALLEKPEGAEPTGSQVDPPKYIRKPGLKGGIGGDTKGGLFGDPSKFG